MTRQLCAGTSRRAISPPRGIFLVGYGDRSKGNIGIHDHLYATALYLDDGEKDLAIVALDMLAINEFVADRIRWQLAPLQVLLCCSHTHSGPIGYADEKSARGNREYIESLIGNVAAAVNAARQNAQPARLEYSHGTCSVGINRRQQMPDGRYEIGRDPDGARDDSIQVISVLTDPPPDEGTPVRMATVVNYACHGTVLGPDNLLVSADWIGMMRNQVALSLGGEVLFLQGAAANINPDMYWKDDRAFRKAEEQGGKVAAAVVAAIQAGSERIEPSPFKVAGIDPWLPTETPATTKHPPKTYGPKLLSMAHLPGFMSIVADSLLDRRYPWRSTILPQDGFWSVPMRINAVRIGQLALVTFAAETFTEIGMRLKAASPARHTLFASLTDGCISYLHTEESHSQGGYEVDVAPFPYRYPGRLQASCEHIALDAASRLLKHLWEDPALPAHSDA